jgi:hypothetical protein
VLTPKSFSPHHFIFIFSFFSSYLRMYILEPSGLLVVSHQVLTLFLNWVGKPHFFSYPNGIFFGLDCPVI